MLDVKQNINLSIKKFIQFLFRFQPEMSHSLILSVWAANFILGIVITVLLYLNLSYSIQASLMFGLGNTLVIAYFIYRSDTIEKRTGKCPINVLNRKWSESDTYILSFWNRIYKENSSWAWKHFKTSVYCWYLSVVILVSYIIGGSMLLII